jgi:translocation and assembly module TamB
LTRGRRILLRTMFIGIALAVVLGFWVYVTLESEWFFDQVRTRIIATVEKATGGRVEIGGFRFDRSHFTAEVRGLILHGTEPADKPPLFRAASAKIGFKLLSLFRPSVDVLSLEVAEPKVYLVIGPDGRTNVPEPKVP